MSSYATYEDVERGFRVLTAEERNACTDMLDEAAVIIDAFAQAADPDRKKIVSCRMVRRTLANAGANGVPMGATQATMTAGPYSQTWTLGSGSAAGEMYLSKIDKAMLGIGNRIGVHSPLEDMAASEEVWP